MKIKLFLLEIFRVLWILPNRTLKLRKVKNYKDLYQVALWEIDQLSLFGRVSMISAPLFSGGTGDFNKNLNILNRYFRVLSKEGEVIWNQTPYLDIKIKQWAKFITLNTKHKINEFYVPVIQSGNIKRLICLSGIQPELSGYTDSLGCKTERETASKTAIEVIRCTKLSLHL